MILPSDRQTDHYSLTTALLHYCTGFRQGRNWKIDTSSRNDKAMRDERMNQIGLGTGDWGWGTQLIEHFYKNYNCIDKNNKIKTVTVASGHYCPPNKSKSIKETCESKAGHDG